MTVFLITYDLNKEVSRPKIVKHLKDGYASWAKLSESSYAISTSQSVDAVRAYFKPLLDSNDNFYAITLKRPYGGQGPKDVNGWLESNLPY